MAKRGRPKKDTKQYDILKWRIKRYDRLNWVLEELVDGINPRTKEKSQTWKIKGYYGKLDDLFGAVLNAHLVGPKEDVKNLTESIESLSVELKQLAQELAKGFEKLETRN